METIKTVYYDSPAGGMIIGSFNGKICLCDWINSKRRETNDKRLQRCLSAQFETKESEVVESAIAQLEEYFEEKRKIFSIPLLLSGTDFQCSVWSELIKIPYGTTISYRELAERLGNPKAVRAVASANGSNPISIFVPCHRVIGSDHSLTGYAGGIETKKWLIELEKRANNA